jgi:transposase
MDFQSIVVEFESNYGDELREKGYSKDGKQSQPQVVLGLLVSRGGYPLSYAIFKGSQYEYYTMIPIVEDFVQRFNLTDFVIVADSGLMNSRNIQMIKSADYKYIAGAKIKEPERILAATSFNMSVDKVLSIAKTVATIKVRQPHNNSIMTLTLLLTPEHRRSATLFEPEFWKRVSQ